VTPGLVRRLATERVRVTDRPDPRLLLAAGVVSIAVLIGLIATYIDLLLTGGAGAHQSDFVAYYSGARLVWTDHAVDLYNFHSLGTLQAGLVHPLHVRDGVLPFVYPPFFAMLLAPLSALPLTPAYLAWLAVNVSLLAVTLAALARMAGLGGRSQILFGVVSLSFLPVFVSLTQGQTATLLLVFVTACFLALIAGHDAAAGAALGLVLIKPPYVLPLLLVLVLRTRWKALIAFAATTTFLIAIPAVLLSRNILGAYLHTLTRAMAWREQFGYGPTLNHSLAGFTQLLLHPAPAAAAQWALAALVVVALIAIVRKMESIEVALAYAAVAALLISPHVLIHDLSLLLLPAAVALRCRAAYRPALTAILVLGYIAVLVGPTVMRATHVQLTVLAMLAFAWWLAAIPGAPGRSGSERSELPAVIDSNS